MCGKESVAPAASGSLDVGKRFVPEQKDILPLIHRFDERKAAYLTGAKTGTDETPLQEALWLSEAAANSEKGNGELYTDEWIEGSTTYTLPVTVHPDGSVTVSEADLFEKHNELMIALDEMLPFDDVYMIDEEILSVGPDGAIITVEWYDKDRSVQTQNILLPSFTGCFPVVTPPTSISAVQIMKMKIRAAFHPLEPNTFVTGLYPQSERLTVDEEGYHGPYAYYLGTADALGGPSLLYSGPNTEYAMCFPLYWDRFLELRARVQQLLGPGQRIVKEIYDHSVFYRTGGPWEYGSLYYPMGPYDTYWYFQVGNVVQGELGPE